MQMVRSQTGRLRLMIAPLKLSTHPLSSALLFSWLHSSKTNKTDLPVSFNRLWILSSPEVAMDSNWKIELSTSSTNRHREASSRRWGRRQSSNMALLVSSSSASVPGLAFATFWIRSRQRCQQCDMTKKNLRTEQTSSPGLDFEEITLKKRLENSLGIRTELFDWSCHEDQKTLFVSIVFGWPHHISK